MYTVHISTLWSISIWFSEHRFCVLKIITCMCITQPVFFCASLLLWRFNGHISLLYLISLFLSVGHRPAPRDPIVTVASVHFRRSHVVVQQIFPVGVALQWRHLGYGDDGMVQWDSYVCIMNFAAVASYKHTQKVNFVLLLSQWGDGDENCVTD